MRTLWTPATAERMLTHPVYVGMGPYPAIVEEETWLDVNARLIEERGAETAIGNIVRRFQETFPEFRILDAGAFVAQAQNRPRVALRHLLAELQDLFDARALAGGGNSEGAR